MKIKNILMTAAIALVGVASANAVNTTYTSGDVILGITQTGNANCYEVNLGSASNFMTLNTWSYQVNTTDMANIFGSGWANDSTVSFGLAGAGTSTLATVLGQVKGTTWVSAPSGSAWTTGGGGQNNAAQAIIGMTTGSVANGGFKSETVNVLGANAAKITSSLSSSWATLSNKNGASFVNYNPTVSASFDSNSSVAVAFYQVDNTTSKDLGNFTMSDSGALSFQAVPEPSTYAMLTMGGLGLLGMLRRRRA